MMIRCILGISGPEVAMPMLVHPSREADEIQDERRLPFQQLQALQCG